MYRALPSDQTLVADLMVAFPPSTLIDGNRPASRSPAVRKIRRSGPDVADPIGAKGPAAIVCEQLDPEPPRASFDRAREELGYGQGEVVDLVRPRSQIVRNGRRERPQHDAHAWIGRDLDDGAAHRSTLSE